MTIKINLFQIKREYTNELGFAYSFFCPKCNEKMTYYENECAYTDCVCQCKIRWSIEVKAIGEKI